MGSLFLESVINRIISHIEEPMILYVLIEEQYHDNGTIIGVFKSKEAALEGFKNFRYNVDNRLISTYHHTSDNPENSQRCLEGLKTNNIYSLNGSDTDYRILKFKLDEMKPQFC